MNVPRVTRLAVICALVTLGACDSGAAAPERRETGPTAPPTATVTPDGASVPEAERGWLMPNMRSIAASDLQVERVGPVRRLRFAASLANLGDGPMLVVPFGRTGCARGQIRVRQIVHVDRNGDGVFQRRRDVERRRLRGGCMLDHPTHEHWHFDAMAAYRLTVPGTRLRVARNKVSFCLRDNRRAPRFPDVVRRAYFGDCTATSPQGISPGWVDVYGADLDGQWLRLPPRIDRRTVCLTLEADPLGLLLETDESDNATSIPIRINRDEVRVLPTGC